MLTCLTTFSLGWVLSKIGDWRATSYFSASRKSVKAVLILILEVAVSK